MPGALRDSGTPDQGGRKPAMNPKPETFRGILQRLLSVICVILLIPGDTLAGATYTGGSQTTAPQSSPAQGPTTKIPADELDSLVAPIALYPDPMLAQTLAASTYPLELIQLQQWLVKNPTLKDKALADAVAKEPWDPSIQAMAALPDLVKRLADDIQWTTDLGNAFLAQQKDVMDAVQRMRKKAQDKGNLKTTEQQKVETKVIESKSTIVIEQAKPQVVYVPSYDPVVVYGPPVYPYPPIYYPPPGYYAAGLAISFGIGVMMGAFWGGGWGWGCGWGGGNVNVNINNSFNRNTNIGGGNRPSQLPARGGAGGVGGVGSVGGVGGVGGVGAVGGGGGVGGAGGAGGVGGVGGAGGVGSPGGVGGAGKPGGVGGVGGAGSPGGVGGAGGAGSPGGVGGAGGANRPSQLPAGGAGGNNWQHNPAHRGGAPYGDRATADRFGGAARGDSLANRQAGARNQIGRQGGSLPSNRGGAGASNRMNTGGGAGAGNRGGGGFGGSPDRIGSRDVSRPSGADRSAFGSGSRGGYNGSSARSASSRGSSSFGGGGGRGGGGRSGGGRRR